MKKLYALVVASVGLLGVVTALGQGKRPKACAVVGPVCPYPKPPYNQGGACKTQPVAPTPGVSVQYATADTHCIWKNRSSLKVKFLGGDTSLQDRVKKVAQLWTSAGTPRLDFVGPEDSSDIRISFTQDNSSWSEIGSCTTARSNEATMNFGWFNSNTTDEEISRTTLHEFGHALGLEHEHQNPSSSIKWDKPYIYDYYSKSQGWSTDKVDHNIFNRLDTSRTTFTTFDPASIMLYPFPSKFTTDGTSTEMNKVLSSTDKEFACRLYSPIHPLSGVVHLQDIGDRGWSGTAWVGTKGQSRRLEGFSGALSGVDGVSVEYMAHLQDKGDTSWTTQGNFCGTRGESRRVEGVAFRLTGSNASKYDITYSCHLQDIGDMAVKKNGDFCGTRGQSRRLEAFQVWITRRCPL